MVRELFNAAAGKSTDFVAPFRELIENGPPQFCTLLLLLLLLPMVVNFGSIGLGYVIAIAFGFLVLLSAILMASYFCIRCLSAARRRRQEAGGGGGGVYLPRIVFVTEDYGAGGAGLEPEVIDSYPKFGFGGSGGEEEDGVCSICLGEFRESETVRMLPDCRHYFHVICIDEWLKLNASCPVCRNSPMPTPLQEVVPLSQYADGRRRR